MSSPFEVKPNIFINKTIIIIQNLLLLTILACYKSSLGMIKTYDFDVIYKDEYPSNSLGDIYENFIADQQLPIVKDIYLEKDNNTYDLFLNSGSYFSWITNKNCSSCTWSDKKLNFTNKLSDLYQSCAYWKFSGYYERDTFSSLSKNIPINLEFISVTNSNFMNTKVKLSGVLGIGLWDNDTKNISIIKKIFDVNPKEEKLLAIEYLRNNLTNTTKGKLYIYDFPINIKNNLTSCAQYSKAPIKAYWSCKMDYILFGEEYDFYLAKPVDEFIIFDTLSYFNIIPYYYLDYFLSTYFFPNDNCTVVSVNTNMTLFRIECFNNLGIERFKSLNIIINGWAYRLGSKSLFDQVNVIDYNLTNNNTYYFRFLFSKTVSGWTIGTGFFKKFILAYNYTSHRVLFQSNKDRHNFTLYTREDFEDNVSLFYAILFSVFSVIFIFIVVMYLVFHFKKKRILESYVKINNE